MPDCTSPLPWQPGALKLVPFLSFISLFASLATAALALYIVQSADIKPVNSWPIAPSVYLSILATISSALLRSAFQSGAETYWWSLLLSKNGVKLRTLQDVWELGHDTSARFTMNTSLSPIVRLAGIFILLLAANGPLLQRAVTVDVIRVVTDSEMTLDVRREPMWNMTTKVLSSAGWIWSPSAYQDEFAEAVVELNQRRTIRLLSSQCPADSTCTTTVTVAGFGRTCDRPEDIPDDDVELLPDFNPIVFGRQPLVCSRIGRESEKLNPGCGRVIPDYQLVVHLEEPSDRQPQDSELPWLAPDLPPNALKYTNIFREDVHSGRLTRQECTFTSAFVEMPINIIQGNEIRMMELSEDQLVRRNKGVESIPAAAVDTPNRGTYATYSLMGIEQTMADLYGGYSFFDTAYDTPAIRGMGPRQAINQSSITSRVDTGINKGHSFSFENPLEAFTDTLHELSLRYALKKMVSTSERTEELEGYFGGFSGVQAQMEKAREQMKIAASPQQQVMVQAASSVPVYRAHMLFAAIAVGISLATMLMVTALFSGWRRLVRRFTFSPLEIAKAFDGPLLRPAGSNADGRGIAATLGSLNVGYGESEMQSRDTSRLLDTPTHLKTDPGQSGKPVVDTGLVESLEVGEADGAKLAVDMADRVSRPVKGKLYA